MDDHIFAVGTGKFSSSFCLFFARKKNKREKNYLSSTAGNKKNCNGTFLSSKTHTKNLLYFALEKKNNFMSLGLVKLGVGF